MENAPCGVEQQHRAGDDECAIGPDIPGGGALFSPVGPEASNYPADEPANPDNRENDAGTNGHSRDDSAYLKTAIQSVVQSPQLPADFAVRLDLCMARVTRRHGRT